MLLITVWNDCKFCDKFKYAFCKKCFPNKK
jgi:hypothetical protein